MALTKVLRGGLNTGISDSSDATAITIDSSENVMINTTNTNPAESNVAGVSLMATNAISACDDGSAPIQLNRKSDNGSIAIFRKDGTGVGNIGVHDDDGFFFTRSATQQGIVLKNSSLMPCNTDGSNSDADQDIGISSVRWKDLYLSGGVLLGGTGSANKISDYEEGTWTPQLTDLSNNATMHSLNGGVYTKIGRVVTVTANVRTTSLGSVSGNLYLTGFPFASANTNGNHGAGSVANAENMNITAGHSIQIYFSKNGSQARWDLYDSAAGITALQGSEWSSDGQASIQVTYSTA
mgnify:FL=1